MATGSETQQEDWYAVLEALQDGDAMALARLTRLINGFLASWNAYDFRSDWEAVSYTHLTLPTKRIV